MDRAVFRGGRKCATRWVRQELGAGEWRLTGERIEKAAAMTNWDYAEAQDRFQRIVEALSAGPRTLLQLQDVHAADLQQLLESAIITFDEDEFGEAICSSTSSN